MAKVHVEERKEWKKVNPCTDPFARRRIEVGTRFVVVAMVCEGAVSDGMWVRLEHAAQFRDRAEAEKLVHRVEAAARASWMNPLAAFDMTKWIWSPSPTNAWASMQQTPTAVPFNVG